eukprot:2985458-Prymnesium_polylepis.1
MPATNCTRDLPTRVDLPRYRASTCTSCQTRHRRARATATRRTISHRPSGFIRRPARNPTRSSARSMA